MNRREMMLAGGALATGVGTIARAAVPGEDMLRIEFAYEAIVTLAAAMPVGPTPYGARNRIPLTGGSFEGPRIRGKVLPGGMDWQLIRPDGMLEVYADYMMQADDGALIHVVNKGLISTRSDRPYVRTTPWFEAPNGPHAWLNESVFTGTIGAPPPGAKEPAVRIRIFRMV